MLFSYLVIGVIFVCFLFLGGCFIFGYYDATQSVVVGCFLEAPYLNNNIKYEHSKTIGCGVLCGGSVVLCGVVVLWCCVVWWCA